MHLKPSPRRTAMSHLLHRISGACAPLNSPRLLARAVNTLRSSLALNPSLRLGVDRKTKIVCTVGPACVNILPDMSVGPCGRNGTVHYRIALA